MGLNGLIEKVVLSIRDDADETARKKDATGCLRKSGGEDVGFWKKVVDGITERRTDGKIRRGESNQNKKSKSCQC